MIKRKKYPDKQNIFFIFDKPNQMYCMLSCRKLQSNNRQCFFFVTRLKKQTKRAEKKEKNLGPRQENS